MIYLAIDVGGTAIKYLLTDESARTIEIKEVKSNTESQYGLFNSLDKIISPNLNQIDGIALSFPGSVDVKKGIVHAAGNFGWIEDLPLKSILEGRYSKKVWIENDGKCCALAEFWRGNLSDVKNGAVMGLGTGIAGGIIINGELYRGINGCAGEFSSMIDNLENPKNARKLSEIAGYMNLLDRYVESKGANFKISNAHEFFENYHNGDEVAICVLKDYAKAVSGAIITIQGVLDLEKFCIGGGISSQDALINEIRQEVHDYFINNQLRSIKEPIIEECFFRNAAGCVGALYNFLNMEQTLNTD